GKGMGQKSRKKLDVSMVILMIVVMSYQATGNLFHEAAGVILLVLFVVHNILNRKWYQNIPKGKYSGFRNMMLIINILTLICMLAAMGTGIYLSQSVFASLLGMREAYLIRPWHVAAGAWGLILVSFHAGMHIRISGKQKPLYMIGGILLATFGIWAFFALDMPNRLILRDMGMYWRYSGIRLFLANASMMTLFAGLVAILADWLKRKCNKTR
ncbi:MAG: DUF4405 domain-containing protein, partial [Eubacteriales bacterium]|nr:DUF4405 domain-containing protein [Eubacteriales bacterium]